jgi:hypothetical protein
VSGRPGAPAPRGLVAALLRRLALGPARGELVVRGSLVTAHHVAPRPRTAADLDLLADRLEAPSRPFDPSPLAAAVEALLATPCDDGRVLALEGAEVIWAETDFPGWRATVVDGEARLQLDVGVGDPLVDGPVEAELLPGFPVRVVRAETLLGWKVHGLFEHGPGRWRAKDLHDVDLLLRFAALDADRAARALSVAFSSRGDALGAIDRLLDGDFGHSRGSRRKWRRFAESTPDTDALEPTLARIARGLRPLRMVGAEVLVTRARLERPPEAP